jgi:hypothetical protein
MTQNHGLGAALDANVTHPAVRVLYKNATTAQFVAYDPANPPPPRKSHRPRRIVA